MKAIHGTDERYFITKDGRVWSKKRSGSGGYATGKFVKPRKTGRYFQFWFYIKGSIWQPLAHRLVAEAYIDNPLNLPQINHKNGIKTDNRVENLEWCSAQENTRHALKTGLISLGEERQTSKLSDEIVKEIRLARKNGVMGTVLAKKYNVSTSCICSVYKRQVWKHI